jgi:hypothetical protein
VNRSHVRLVVIVGSGLAILLLAACGWHWRQQIRSTGQSWLTPSIRPGMDWNTPAPPTTVGAPLPVVWANGQLNSPCQGYSRGRREHQQWCATLADHPDTLTRNSLGLDLTVEL